MWLNFLSFVAAVGIAGPLERLKLRKIKALGPIVIEIATSIAAALGVGLPTPAAMGRPVPRRLATLRAGRPS